MEYVAFCVKRDGVKPIEKNASNKKYTATNFSRISTPVYRCSKLQLLYVGTMFTQISALN